MSKKEKDVELIPNPPAGWKVKHGINEGNGPPNYPKVEFAPNSGPHLVVFTLPKTGAATFNPTDPMWIQPGTSSPTRQGMDAEFPDWAIFDNGKTLVVLDSNSKAGDYSYRVKADGYSPVLDPIIKNGGGTFTPPTAPSTSYSMTEVGIAVLIAFLVGFFVHRLFFARSKTTG